MGERIIREFGMDTCTLLHLKWLTNKDLLSHLELCSMSRGSLDGRGVWARMDTCIRMAESLCCPLEIITILLSGYAPEDNKKFKLRKRHLICDQNFGLKRSTPNYTDLKFLQQPFSPASCSAKEKGTGFPSFHERKV